MTESAGVPTTVSDVLLGALSRPRYQRSDSVFGLYRGVQYRMLRERRDSVDFYAAEVGGTQVTGWHASATAAGEEVREALDHASGGGWPTWG